MALQLISRFWLRHSKRRRRRSLRRRMAARLLNLGASDRQSRAGSVEAPDLPTTVGSCSNALDLHYRVRRPKFGRSDWRPGASRNSTATRSRKSVWPRKPTWYGLTSPTSDRLAPPSAKVDAMLRKAPLNGSSGVAGEHIVRRLPTAAGDPERVTRQYGGNKGPFVRVGPVGWDDGLWTAGSVRPQWAVDSLPGTNSLLGVCEDTSRYRWSRGCFRVKLASLLGEVAVQQGASVCADANSKEAEPAGFWPGPFRRGLLRTIGIDVRHLRTSRSALPT